MRRGAVVAAVLGVAVLAVAAVFVVRGGAGDDTPTTRVAWEPPPQMLIAPSVATRPTPGWRLDVVDLGLPPQSRIATSEAPFDSSPFVGTVGGTALFVASDPDGDATRWWLLGIATAEGRPAFPAVALGNGARAPQCYPNGPAAVLCLRVDDRSATAWVVDTTSGAVTFTGPTDLRTYPDVLRVRPVGAFAVAETRRQGVYGIGPAAQTTWFVPGAGTEDRLDLRGGDVIPSSLISQTGPARGASEKVVFSADTGAVVAPRSDDPMDLRGIQVYPGGFAADVAVDAARTEVRFFDESGARVGDNGVDAHLLAQAHDLPVLQTTDGWAVYSPQGDLLLQMPGPAPSVTRLIGATFLAELPVSTIDKVWHQYDLRSGTEGTACDYPGNSVYVGSDGKVMVLDEGNANVGLVTTAYDLATCNALWTIESPPGSFRDVWRADTTLVQLSDDGAELTSLVSPVA